MFYIGNKHVVFGGLFVCMGFIVWFLLFFCLVWVLFFTLVRSGLPGSIFLLENTGRVLFKCFPLKICVIRKNNIDGKICQLPFFFSVANLLPGISFLINLVAQDFVQSSLEKLT